MIGDRAGLRGLIHLQEPALRSFLYRQYSASVQGGHCAVLLRTRHYQGRDGHTVRHFALCLQRQALALQFILNRDLPEGLEVELLHLLEAGDRYLFTALLIDRHAILRGIAAKAAAGNRKRSIGPDSAAVSAGGVALIAATGDGQAVGRVKHAAIALGAVIPEHAALQGYAGARLILISNATLSRRAVVLKCAAGDGERSGLQPEYAAVITAPVVSELTAFNNGLCRVIQADCGKRPRLIPRYCAGFRRESGSVPDMRCTAKHSSIAVPDLATVEGKVSVSDLDRTASRNDIVHLSTIRIGLIIVILQNCAAAKGQLRLHPGQDQGSAGLHSAVCRASFQDVVHSASPFRAAVQRDILYRQVGAIAQGNELIAVAVAAVHAVSAAVQRQLFAGDGDCLRDGHILTKLYGASVRRVRNRLCQTAVAGTVYNGHKAAHLDLCGGRQDLVARLTLAVHQISGCGVAARLRGQIACAVRAGDHGLFTAFAQLVPAVSDGMRPCCRLNGQRPDRVALPVGRALGRDEHGHLWETHLYLEGSCQFRSPYCGGHSLLPGHRRVISAERHILCIQVAAVLHD